MKKVWIFGLVVVFLLLLSGCVGQKSKVTPTPTVTQKVTPTVTPTPTTTPTNTTTLGEGERDGPLFIQKIFSDHIEGLNFREYPISRGYGENITLYIGQSASNGCTVTLTLTNIIQLQTYPPTYKAVFSKYVDYNRPCPICLSENTSIDTPNGYVSVKSIRKEDAVWTSDINGSRQIVKVLKTTKIQVKNHQMGHIKLDDGREVYASPNHPLADGRPIGSIVVGDIVDSARVIIAELVPYQGDYTYDILPSGDTRTYWANGVLLRSTIRSV